MTINIMPIPTHPPLSPLSADDFAQLGMEKMVFIKQVSRGDHNWWAICAANGTPLAVAPSRDLAFAAVTQQNYVPLSTH